MDVGARSRGRSKGEGVSPAWLGTCIPTSPKLVTTKAPMSKFGCPLSRRGTAHAAHAAMLTRVEASISDTAEHLRAKLHVKPHLVLRTGKMAYRN